MIFLPNYPLLVRDQLSVIGLQCPSNVAGETIQENITHEKSCAEPEPRIVRCVLIEGQLKWQDDTVREHYHEREHVPSQSAGTGWMDKGLVNLLLEGGEGSRDLGTKNNITRRTLGLL